MDARSNRTKVERKSERELVVTRIFNAPPSIVFEAWTKPELLKRWWAPKSTGMALLSCEADVRVGGGYRFELGQAASNPMVFFGRYIEVLPPSRLVWTNDEGAAGAITTVTFEEKGAKTLLVMHELHPSKEALDAVIAGMEAGMSESFEQLAGLLGQVDVLRTMRGRTAVKRESQRELVVTRTFNGPARIVFDAWTKPELLNKWWAPKSFGVSLFVCESDLRVGGTYRYEFGRDPKNPEVFSGRYIEVSPPVRLALTQVYERMREVGEVVVTVTFEESDGRTHLTLRQLFPSKEALDSTIASGMEDGMRATFEQLDALIASFG